jgi:predicted deacetylase
MISPANTTPAGQLLVSIHDVTPAHADTVQSLWRDLRARGVTPALFVVPNWHGQWPLARHGAFVDWLQQCAADGAELFLHGERHDEAGLVRRAIDHLRAVGRTAAEGEFLGLDAWQARERIERGVLLLWSLDLRPVGFVPPAWLALPSTHDVVRDVGLSLSEDARRVYVHNTETGTHAIDAPALRWSGRTTLRARASRAVGEWRWRSTRNAPVVRLALHPQDLAHPVTAGAVREAIDQWPTMRAPQSYGVLCP